LARRYLERLGYVPIERNYRTRFGELDLILRRADIMVLVISHKTLGGDFES
jgi:putative endonuclease